MTKARPHTNTRRVLSALLVLGEATVNQLAAVSGVKRQEAGRGIKQLEYRELAKKIGRKRSDYGTTYQDVWAYNE